MTSETKALLGIGLATILIFVVGITLINKQFEAKNQPVQVDPATLVTENSQKIATDSAKVTIVEFADYQCPACAASHPIIKKVLQDYPQDVTFVYRHFPLPNHPNAQPAALAAEAAGKQNKFWEMHNLIFERQEKWSTADDPEEIFTQYAQELQLNVEQFKTDLEDPQLKEKIQADLRDARKLGVNSTPTFYINGTQYPGVQQYDELKQIIESAQ